MIVDAAAYRGCWLWPLVVVAGRGRCSWLFVAVAYRRDRGWWSPIVVSDSLPVVNGVN